MTEKEKYALEWNNSAEYFYEHRSYKHLCEHIKQYATVLEVGCGTGQSTLSLLESGHTVIAVDQNRYCIEIAKRLIAKAGYSIKESVEELVLSSVCFIEYDITESNFISEISPDLSFDVVLCWNVGTYWDDEKDQDSVPKMLQYGLTPEQIKANTESSYGELIIWHSCAIAENKKCAVNIVDRGTRRITKQNDPYYSTLKKEFNFKKIKYINLKATTLSQGGRQLITNGEVNKQKELPIIFVSVLLQ